MVPLSCVLILVLTFFVICREDFRETFKKENPKNKSVATVSVICGQFKTSCTLIFGFIKLC